MLRLSVGLVEQVKDLSNFAIGTPGQNSFLIDSLKLGTSMVGVENLVGISGIESTADGLVASFLPVVFLANRRAVHGNPALSTSH